MSEQPVIVQKISWSDLCPWTLIFKTLPVASSVTVMVFALLGVVLTPIGWMLIESLVVNQEMRDSPLMADAIEINRSPYRGVFLETKDNSNATNIMGVSFAGLRLVFRQFVDPFEHLFGAHWGIREFVYFLLGSLWSLAIWSFVGVAISRVCLLRLTRNEACGIDDAFEFAVEKWRTVVGAIGIPLLAVAALCIPTFLIGLLMGFDAGVVIAGLLWFIVLALAAVMGLLLVGLLFGWPLMVSSVGCESQNSFDAMTRAYAYVFQRPLHYAFYALLAILFGGFCWLIVSKLTVGIVDLSYWSTSWGANIAAAERIEIIRENPITLVDGEAVADSSSSSLTAGRNIIGLWNSLLKTLAAAFLYGLFWCVASAIYLLLRKDVDETETDEIFIYDEKRTYELPQLKTDEHGIPQVQTPVPVDESSPESTDGDENRDSQSPPSS